MASFWAISTVRVNVSLPAVTDSLTVTLGLSNDPFSVETLVPRSCFTALTTRSAAPESAGAPPTFQLAPSFSSMYGFFTPLTSTRFTSALSSRWATFLLRRSRSDLSKVFLL